MVRLLKGIVDRATDLYTYRKESKLMRKYAGNGEEFAEYLYFQFGIEQLFYMASNSLKKIGFPNAEVFDVISVDIKVGNKWILICCINLLKCCCDSGRSGIRGFFI